MDAYYVIDNDRRTIMASICAWLCQLSEGVAKGQSDVAPYKVVNLAQAVTAERKLVRLCSHAVLAAIETLGKHNTLCSILLTNTSKANFRG